jgi:predicted phosphodiesterase
MASSSKKRLIGIMADSHGNRQSIARAIGIFRQCDCLAIYHLGDICDSLRPETADACVDLLRRHYILGIKGNNDHTLAVNLRNNTASCISSDTITYLEQLPLALYYDSAVLAHSLPFVVQRGLACMIGDLNAMDAALFFKDFPDNFLFRGHNHTPEIVWQQEDRLENLSLPAEEKISFADRIPCIITCGALDHGFCLTWDVDDHILTCHTFDKREYNIS